MSQDRKDRLIELGAEALADALLELASRDGAADDLVERMVATPKDNIKRYKTKLAALKRRKRFVRWGESAAFARELRAMLADLRSGVADPRTGVELAASFYEANEAVLGRCDDSSGHIGDVFRFDARVLFGSYASRCDDKQWLGDLVLKFNRKDDYCVRDVLIDCAAEYLPEFHRPSHLSRLWGRSTRHCLHHRTPNHSKNLAPLAESKRRFSCSLYSTTSTYFRFLIELARLRWTRNTTAVSW